MADIKPLQDSFGRVANDLRISLVDKCNLRCTYCMPEEGMLWLKSAQLLTATEAIRIADIGIRLLGVTDVRFTGGEPLIRRDLEEIIAGVRDKHPDVPLSITTNAIGLESRIAGLKEAGLTRINVSLDTVDRDDFAAVTRRDRLDDVIRGIEAAKDAGLEPVKVNAVLMRRVNDSHAVELLEWCLERGLQLRFIEQMPLDADHNWAKENLVSAAEIRSRMGERFSLSEHAAPRGSAPAQLWDVRERGGSTVLGQVGIIASVTESFCGECSRTRITAEGTIRSCLFSHEETSLMELLRDGSSDEAIASKWRQAMWAKPRAYGSNTVTSLGSPQFVQPERSMSAIGG